jgi:hypothetical protein
MMIRFIELFGTARGCALKFTITHTHTHTHTHTLVFTVTSSQVVAW